MKIRAYHVSLLLFYLSIISLIAWGGFGWSWWEPTTVGDGRGDVLIVLHVVGLISPLLFEDFFGRGK